MTRPSGSGGRKRVQLELGAMGASSYRFESGGKVYIEAMGIVHEAKYELDGEMVKIITPMGTQVFSMGAEGDIRGPMGIKLTKQEK